MSIATQQRNWAGGTHFQPGITEPLMAALTSEGREALLRELRSAIENADSPQALLRVVEAWYVTLQMRNRRKYHQRLRNPGPARTYLFEEFVQALKQ